MQIWIHDNKMKKIVALNNDIPDMLSYTNSSWHSYLDQATSTFDFTIPKFSNGELHEDLKLINDECFVSFYVNGSYQVFYIATLQEDDFNIQLTCNNTNLEYALEYANPFSSESAQTIEWYLNHMDLLSFAAVEIGLNEISDRKRTLIFDSQETKMNRLQSLMSKFEAEFEFKVELNRDGTYKRIVINIYQKDHIGTDRKDVVLYYSNGLKGVQVTSDKTQMFNAGVFTGKDGLSLNDVEISEKNADGIEEFYSRKGNPCLYAPIAMNRYPATMRAEGQDNWIRKDFTTEYENVNDLKAYALRTLKQYAYPLVTYTASVQSGFVSQYTDLKLGDTIRIIDKNFVGGLALEARVSEMIVSFDNPANNSFVFTNYRKLDNKPSSALQMRIEQVIESRLSYRIELATTGGVTFKNNEGETIVKPSLYKGNLPWTKDVTWHWTLNSIVTDGMQYRIQARDITDTAVLTVDAFVGGNKVATTEITLTNINDGPQGPQGPQGDDGPKGDKGDTGNGIANTVITYGLSVSDTTEPATWSSSVPTLVKGMYLWTRTVIIYTNGESTTSYQISYIAKDADATAAIDKTKQELLEKLDTVRNDSLAAVEEAKQELTTVADDLSKAKTDLQNAVSVVDTKATNLKSDLSKAKQDLTSQAQQLQAQGSAQSELTKRVSSVEKTANGTKTTVSELSKTVAQNGKDITSVTARTKTVEDDLSGTKTTLSQVKTTADSTSQKTATLETGLNGLSAKFDSLTVGGANLFKGSRDFSGSWENRSTGIYAEDYKDVKIFKKKSTWSGYSQYFEAKADEEYVFSAYVKSSAKTDRVSFYLPTSFKEPQAQGLVSLGTASNTNFVTFDLTDEYQRIVIKIRITKSGWILPRIERTNEDAFLFFGGYKLEHGNVATDYIPSDADIEQKVAEYKQTADQNYASLQTTVQNLDGTVQQNKTTAEQTAAGFKTRIESLETYKSGESTRANQYFESAKTETARQLTAERTAIAKDYVAKSTYTSDVTGIRNDLTATTTTANTTKTNLANYQASNDKAVANLQSNLQTANGNISSLKTKVEAVPGQITSAVTAVEGKIPKSVNTVNLIKNTDKPFTMAYGITNTTWDDDKKWAYLDLTDPNVSTAKGSEILPQGQFYNFKPTKGMTYTQSIMIDTDATFNPNGQAKCSWFTSSGHNQQKAYIKKVGEYSYQVWSTYTWKLENTRLRAFDWYDLYDILLFRTTGTYLAFYKPKLTTGTLPSDWSPAPEDTVSQISSLSSQIQQTADGMTLLATKTELNTAKNELQSGITTATNKANAAQNTANNNAKTISTHTTQISALNTGLSAKVSQTDFNTLSGRVTTAENNITAKANELSSKITSVESKIPTSAGGRNYIKNSEYRKTSIYVNDSQVQDEAFDISTAFWQNSNVYAKKIKLSFYYQPSVAYATERQFSVYFRASPWPLIGVVTYPANTTRLIKYTIAMTNGLPANFTASQIFMRFNGNLDKGRYHDISKVMLEVSDVFSDWQPAPEDYDSKLASAQSEIKQTTDSIKASVSSLDSSTVKSSSLTINADGIVMKAGKSTTDVANAIGSYFAVNQNAINIFSDKINVKGNMIVSGAITSDKIASNSIDASKIAANAITANMITGGQLRSTNGATVFDLNAGTLTFNNNYGYIQRVAGDKIFEITTYLGKSLVDSQDYLTSAFNVRKSDNSRQSGIQFSLYNTLDNQPTATAKINSDSLNLYNSQNTKLFSVNGRSTYLGNFNIQGWGDIPVAQVYGGLIVKDIGIGGHIKPLLQVVEELCKKAGITWI